MNAATESSENQSAWSWRPIEPRDDVAVAAIIRAVMPEFRADGPGFAIHDPEVSAMSRAYSAPNAIYLVVELDGKLVGGGGIASLRGGADGVCELQKMYFLRQARGRGLGRALIEELLLRARSLGYRTCYLETLTGMDAALRLYEQQGFQRRCAPLGATGHSSCDRWYELELQPARAV
jgi:putative acetyltransferase